MIAYPLTQDILCLGSHSSKPNLFSMKCVESTTLWAVDVVSQVLVEDQGKYTI